MLDGTLRFCQKIVMNCDVERLSIACLGPCILLRTQCAVSLVYVMEIHFVNLGYVVLL